MNLLKTIIAFGLLAQLFFSASIAAQSTEVMNQDTLRRYYPSRQSIMDRPIPIGFLDYRPYWSKNWLLVEKIHFYLHK